MQLCVCMYMYIRVCSVKRVKPSRAETGLSRARFTSFATLYPLPFCESHPRAFGPIQSDTKWIWLTVCACKTDTYRSRVRVYISEGRFFFIAHKADLSAAETKAKRSRAEQLDIYIYARRIYIRYTFDVHAIENFIAHCVVILIYTSASFGRGCICFL